mmetsp:Transcript_44721/g.72589  ORF Transcript_44721/g.72589 Transcript_44721/m.72589 type:complete len:91 (-) Transcript_44721:99-371(-)
MISLFRKAPAAECIVEVDDNQSEFFGCLAFRFYLLKDWETVKQKLRSVALAASLASPPVVLGPGLPGWRLDFMFFSSINNSLFLADHRRH